MTKYSTTVETRSGYGMLLDVTSFQLLPGDVDCGYADSQPSPEFVSEKSFESAFVSGRGSKRLGGTYQPCQQV